MPDELLTAADVAQRLGIKPRTVLQWALRGHLPVLRISPKVVRFDWHEVLGAIRESAEPEHRRTFPSFSGFSRGGDGDA